MLNDLFIDSLNALASELEANVFHLVTRSRKISEKMQTLTMELLSFKCQVYSSIAKFIGNWQGNYGNKNESFGSQTTEQLKYEITVSSDKLFRYRLHHILKDKAGKKRRDSMLASSLSNHHDQELTQLQKSILLIEKDLGIEAQNDENQKLGITRIINNSLFLGLDSTPISKIGGNNYSIVSEAGSVSMDLTSKEIQQDLAVSLAKQNYQENSKSFQSQSKNLPIAKKMIIGKKKKKNVEKSDLLGNLLEETYSQCLDKA